MSGERLSHPWGSIGAMDIAGLTAGLVIGLLVGAALAAAVVWSWLGSRVSRERDRAVRAEALLSSTRSEAETARARITEMSAMADLLTPVRESLESLRRASDAASRDRATAEATLTSQLTSVQERYQSLESATTQLAGALARGQTRGQWGEMQLEGLLEHAGLLEGVHLTRQGSRPDARPDGAGLSRPDVVVHLPGGGEVLVDAKFPFDAYWQAAGLPAGPERDDLLRKHASDLLARSRELSAKGYSDSDRSPDFVVMFLPLESLLSAALEVDGLLLEKTFERQVILATPTTMLALLRTIAFGYQRQLMAENAEQVRQAGAEMLARLATLTDHLDGMRRGLDQAVRGYNAFVGSFDRQAMRQARRMRDLGVDTPKSLAVPEEIDVELRQSDPAALRSD